MTKSDPRPDQLARRLNTFDAVMVGLGAMLGAGIFVVIGPAVDIAGNGVLAALLIAAAVAYCNAVSSARLAAVYPESGGTYVYGRRCLGPLWGYLAGWGFLVGKVASCAAMALTFAAYVAPQYMKPVAVIAVLALTAVNWFGIQKTALLTRLIVCVVLIALAVAVMAVLGGGQVDTARLAGKAGWTPAAILQAAALWFFAFAGYARLATLGEEVVDPARTIPRAIPLALGITLLLYLIVAMCALVSVESTLLAQAAAPLVVAVEAGALADWSPVVRLGAAVACLGVLLSLILGISRTLFAMARQGDMPKVFSAVHPRYRVPHRAELVVGAGVAIIVCLADVRTAIGFSAFTVLFYYAITNLAALRLSREQASRWGRGGRGIAWAGLAGCGLLALSLPLKVVLGGATVLLLGGAWFFLRGQRPSMP